jgi:hydrogenase/urease accessory protein HupE
MKRLLQLALLALCLVPTTAFAHVGIGSASGFIHGFMHPLSGLDHQLAMVLVGIFAYRLGGRALWLVPLTFVSVMALGGFLGVARIPVPFVEVGIALSVIVLGAIVAFGVKAPVAVAMGVVGLFAIFHGHAHGSESLRKRTCPQSKRMSAKCHKRTEQRRSCRLALFTRLRDSRAIGQRLRPKRDPQRPDRHCRRTSCWTCQ